MADLTLEQITDFFKNLDPSIAMSYLDKISHSSISLNEAFDKMYKSGQNVFQVIKSGSLDAAELSQIIEKSKNAVVELGMEFGVSAAQVKKMTAEVAQFALVLGIGFRPEAFQSLGRFAGDAGDNIENVNTKIAGVTNLLSKIPGVGKEIKSVVDYAMTFKQLADYGKQAQAGIINMAASSGELGTLINQVGDNFSGLDAHLRNYNSLIVSVADGTGQTVSQVGKYAAMLGQIPGALTQNIELNKQTHTQINMLDATMKLAAGTGQDFKKVFEDLDRVYRDFGTTGDKAAQYIARVSSASQALKMPLDIVKDYTKSAAQSFKFLGDNSQSAITILGKLGPALKDSGLGPQAIADLTKNVVSNISNMSIAQNAFLSQTSRGIGGLQGAFQIDLLKKQGKLDEVYKMTEDSLKRQFGGRVVTLEEGSKGGAAAGQLLKEVQLLTTGPTKIAENKEQAYAILEAMSKGQGFKPGEEIKTPEKALQDSIKVGTNYQKTQNDLTTKLVNFAEKQTLFAALSANALMRRTTGAESSYVGRYLETASRAGSEKAASIKFFGPEATKTKEESLSMSKITGEISKIDANIRAGAQTANIKEQIKKQQDEFYTGKNTPKEKAYKDLEDISRGKFPSARGRVDRDLSSLSNRELDQQIERQTGLKMGGKSTGKSTIEIHTICDGCHKKAAKDIAIEVVDGKLVEFEKKQVKSNLGSY